MAESNDKLVKIGALEALAQRTMSGIGTVEEKVNGLVTAGGEPNKLEKIKVNGTEQTVGADKSVNITVPTKMSQLSNDSGYQTGPQVQSAVNSALNDFATQVSDDDVVNTYKELVDYAASHGDEAVTMAGDIAGLQTSVDNKVDKVTGKGLSTNDYTTTDKNKLAGIAANANNYTHPASGAGAKSSGLYKVTINAQGHITAATAVTKADITALGIPGQDTTYNVATDAEVAAMLDEVFGS